LLFVSEKHAEAEPRSVPQVPSSIPLGADVTPPMPPPPQVGGIAPVVIMKGGTTSSRYDRTIQASEADAERRRNHQDKQAARARDFVGEDGSIASFGSHKLITGDSPRLVLQYLNRDRTVRQECISEVTQIEGKEPGKLDTMFSLVCPKCLERGLPQGQAQLFIKDSHRKFFLDTSKAGIQMVESGFSRQPIYICGKVTVNDIIRCSQFNCTWAVQIVDSKVMER
jgi:hypothetical protein